ncbi:hypothetical protein ABPG74_020258 [Tetrahymena malaccensis]
MNANLSNERLNFNTLNNIMSNSNAINWNVQNEGVQNFMVITSDMFHFGEVYKIFRCQSSYNCGGSYLIKSEEIKIYQRFSIEKNQGYVQRITNQHFNMENEQNKDPKTQSNYSCTDQQSSLESPQMLKDFCFIQVEEKKEQNNHLLQQEKMQRQEDHLEQENIVKEEEEDKDDDNDDKDSDDDVEIPISKLRFCMVQNLTELTKQFLAEKPDTDLRHGRGFFFGYAIEKNNPELLQLYIDTFQRNYIDRKQKESEVAGKLARFKLRKYLQKGLEYTDDFDQIDDVLVVLKKYIPLDDSEIDRTQDIENDFPKDMKNFTDLSN